MTAPQRAIIVIDVQNDYFGGPLAIQYPARDTSETNMVAMLDTAVEQNIPVALVQHTLPAGAPIFDEGTDGWQNRPALEELWQPTWTRSNKSVASSLADADLVAWLREQKVDTITLVGNMTNNCVLGTAAAAEGMGFAVEVVSDATGAIHMKNSAGEASAQQVHETLMTVLNSNWAAVATTAQWQDAAAQGTALEGSDLVSTALSGAEAFGTK